MYETPFIIHLGETCTRTRSGKLKRNYAPMVDETLKDHNLNDWEKLCSACMDNGELNFISCDKCQSCFHVNCVPDRYIHEYVAYQETNKEWLSSQCNNEL